MKRPPCPGTVIHGTLRPEDLVEAFAAALREYSDKPEDLQLCEEVWTGDEMLDELVDEMFDALDALAPDGHYFGAHPGDGSDFGFWPSHDD